MHAAKIYTLNALQVVTLDERAWQMHKCIRNSVVYYTFIWKSEDSKQEVQKLKEYCCCLVGSVLFIPQMFR